MPRGGRGARNKGGSFEREFARTMPGARRTPLSGGAGGNDLSFATGSLWGVFGWECKRLARLPVYLTKTLAQAAGALPIGSPKMPAAAFREDHGRTIVAFYWDDLRVWVEATVEMAQSHQVRAVARQLHTLADELGKLV